MRTGGERPPNNTAQHSTNNHATQHTRLHAHFVAPLERFMQLVESKGVAPRFSKALFERKATVAIEDESCTEENT